MRCPHCGATTTLDLPGGPYCSGCGLTAELAAATAEQHRRHVARNAEHRRRTALVIAATSSMPMRARLAATAFLLYANGRLPNGEPWDQVFEEWCQRNQAAQQKVMAL